MTADDEAWVLARIADGLALWENVPTSRIRFQTTTVRSATRPTVRSDQLLVIVANGRDLTSGGGTFPLGGAPGVWLGAVADYRANNPSCRDAQCSVFAFVAAHEIGHAIGFLHTTITSQRFDSAPPIMHWAIDPVRGLTQDDVAAVSTAYPDATHPLDAVTGTLSGRCLHTETARALNGVNVVAVSAAGGEPAVARLSGAAGTPGGFDVVGLAPGSYSLLILDGTSVAGVALGLPNNAIQNDNFFSAVLGPFTVAAGERKSVGDVEIDIPPVAPLTGSFPDATQGRSYAAQLPVQGGVRPLVFMRASGLPSGMSVALLDLSAQDHRQSGRFSIRLTGTPSQAGSFTPAFTLRDGEGVDGTVQTGLTVLGPPTTTTTSSSTSSSTTSTSTTSIAGSSSTTSSTSSTTSTTSSVPTTTVSTSSSTSSSKSTTTTSTTTLPPDTSSTTSSTSTTTVSVATTSTAPTTTVTVVTATTTTSLPAAPLCPSGCDDDDPCTRDVCAGGTCIHPAVRGLGAAVCVCERPMPSECADQEIPASITKKEGRACVVLRKTDVTHRNPARRLVARSIKSWAEALHLLGKGAVRKHLSEACRVALGRFLTDGKARGTLVASALRACPRDPNACATLTQAAPSSAPTATRRRSAAPRSTRR